MEMKVSKKGACMGHDLQHVQRGCTRQQSVPICTGAIKASLAVTVEAVLLRSCKATT